MNISYEMTDKAKEIAIDPALIKVLDFEIERAVLAFERRSGLAVQSVWCWPDHPDNAGQRFKFTFDVQSNTPF